MAAGTEVNKELKLQLTHENKKYDIVLTQCDKPLILEDLSRQVETSCGVPVLNQRIIHKGKSLSETGKTLNELGIRSGSKLMLIGKKFSEADEGHLKVMKEVENGVNATKSRLDEIQVEVNDIKKGFLASELQKEALGKLKRRVLVCIEAFQRQLEQLDGISLAKSTPEVQNRRKTIVRRIQEFLQDADNLLESIASLAVDQ